MIWHMNGIVGANNRLGGAYLVMMVIFDPALFEGRIDLAQVWQVFGQQVVFVEIVQGVISTKVI